MGEIKIKSEFLNRVIGFNNSALPLGKRDDIHILADLANKSQDVSLLKLFETVPDSESVAQEIENKILEETSNVETNTSQPTQKKRERKANNRSEK